MIDWDEIVTAHTPRLRAVLRKRLAASSVDDVVQETFLRAYRSREKFDAERPVGPWLTTIALRVASDMQSRAGNIPVASLERPRVAHDAATELASLQGVAVIGRALALLNTRHRRLLEAVALEGASQVEIAAREGLAPEAVRSAVLRARQRFRTVYERLAHEHGLVGLGTSLKPALTRLRIRVLPAEPVLPRNGELVIALLGLLSVAPHTTADVAAATRATPTVDARTTPVAVGADSPSELKRTDPTARVGIHAPGLRTGVHAELRRDPDAGLVDTVWSLTVDELSLTLRAGTDGRHGVVGFEHGTPYDGRARGGMAVQCQTPTMLTSTECAVLEAGEQVARQGPG